MSILYLILGIVFLMLLVELFKHKVMKKTRGLMILTVLVLVILFFTLGYMAQHNLIQTDNSIIITGAAVVDTLEDQAESTDLDISPEIPSFINSPIKKKQ